MEQSQEKNNISPQQRKSDHYCSAALILLSLAIFFLSVVVFTFHPLSVLGILATCVGIVLMIGCILCFIFYNHWLKEEEKTQRATRSEGTVH